MKRRMILLITAMLILVAQLPVTALGAEYPFMDNSEQELVTTSQEEPIEAEHREEGSVQTIERPSGIEKVEGIEVPLAGNEAYIPNNLASGTHEEALAAAKAAITEALFNTASGVKLYDYRITLEELHSMMRDITYSESMLFHKESTYYYSSIGGYAYEVTFKYKVDKATYETQCAFVDEEIARILKNSGVLLVESDLEKALLLNDYIASHYEYDLTYSYYDMYSMMKYKTAVCQGYTLLYDELLTRCGVEVGYAQSDAMNHVWNLVKIGDHYYHVDVTWNDPTKDRFSLARHSYFLLSDGYINSSAPGSMHYDWISSDGIQCQSTLYDESMFTSSRSPFVLCEGDLYYIDFISGEICRYVDAFTTGVAVYSIDARWYVDGKESSSYYYMGVYSGLVSLDGKLYFNTPDQVGAYDINQQTVEWIIDVQASQGDIVGLRYIGDRTIEYATAVDAGASLLLGCYTYLIPAAIVLDPCDVNCDGVMNIDDVNCLLIYLAGIEEDESLSVDVNGDGVVNVTDLNDVLTRLSTME